MGDERPGDAEKDQFLVQVLLNHTKETGRIGVKEQSADNNGCQDKKSGLSDLLNKDKDPGVWVRFLH